MFLLSSFFINFRLDQTLYCQPAVFVSSIAALEKLKANDADAADKITEAAGFSVGEFCALVAGGMLSFQDGLYLFSYLPDVFSFENCQSKM